MIQLAVWGNNGAGKSVISCAVANRLTKLGHNVIVIGADRVAPMFPVYLPLEEEKSEYSLGKLLSGAIQEDRLRHTVQVHPQNNHLGFMALTSGENGLTYQTGWQTNTVRMLVHFFEERKLADAIVFDCTPDVLGDAVALYALEVADAVLQVLSPDVRGVSFLHAQIPIIRGGAFCQNHIAILNNTYDYSPVKQFQEDYEISYVLPHSRGVYTKFCGGELLQGFGDSAGVTFAQITKQIAKRVVKTIE